MTESLTHIRFDNESSETRTAVEIETEDRVGLLYAISQALAELDLNISAAKIVTEKGAAIDTFYIWRARRPQNRRSGSARDSFRARFATPSTSWTWSWRELANWTAAGRRGRGRI